MRARNKIISGKYKEYKFKKKFGMLYLTCLEKEMCINEMTISSISLMEQHVTPSLMSMLFRGYILSKILGMLGVVSGVASAKQNNIYKLIITFADGSKGIAEVNDDIYERMLDIVVNNMDYRERCR